MNRKYFKKLHIKTVISTQQHALKFQTIGRILDFGTKFIQNYMNDKILKK